MTARQWPEEEIILRTVQRGELEAARKRLEGLRAGEDDRWRQLLWSGIIACYEGSIETAVKHIQAAADCSGADEDRLARVAAIIADQRAAQERVDIHHEFFFDSRRARRWAPGRSSALEIFVREGRFSTELQAINEAGKRIQKTAINPFHARDLARSLTRTCAAMEEAAFFEKTPLLVLSDSHSRYFEWLVHEGLLPQKAAGVCSVSQANIYGYFMPSRTVPTRRRFKEALAHFPGHARVILHLGEVDCRAIFWNLQGHVTMSRVAFLEQLSRTYGRILDDIVQSHPEIIVTAPITPTYPARPEDGEIGGDDILILTRDVCELIQGICRQREIPFVSINEELEAFGAGLGNGYFREIPGVETKTHHFYGPKVAGLWSRALSPLLA